MNPQGMEIPPTVLSGSPANQKGIARIVMMNTPAAMICKRLAVLMITCFSEQTITTYALQTMAQARATPRQVLMTFIKAQLFTEDHPTQLIQIRTGLGPILHHAHLRLWQMPELSHTTWLQRRFGVNTKPHFFARGGFVRNLPRWLACN